MPARVACGAGGYHKLAPALSTRVVVELSLRCALPADAPRPRVVKRMLLARVSGALCEVEPRQPTRRREAPRGRESQKLATAAHAARYRR